VPGWRYRRNGLLKTNRHGVANSYARSHSFTASSSVSYFVGVWTTTAAGAPDQLVACAELKGNRKPSKGKGHGHAPAHGKPGAAKGNGHSQGGTPSHGQSGKGNGAAGKGSGDVPPASHGGRG
jgi:hypothetical protein